MTKTETKRVTATVGNPFVEQLLKEGVAFPYLKQAKEYIANFCARFLLPRPERFPEMFSETSFVIFIRGFEVTAEEEGLGYVGNFACIQAGFSNGKHLITARKVQTSLESHPQRKYNAGRKHNHPNKDYKVIRLAIQEKQLRTLEEGLFLLDELVRDYPVATIRSHPRKVSVLVYSSQERTVLRKRVKLLQSEDGGWFLEYSDSPRMQEEEIEGRSLNLYMKNLRDFCDSIAEGIS